MLKTLLSQVLRKTADDLDADRYNCDEEQMKGVLDELYQFNDELPLSKDQACSYLGMSRSKFDQLVREGKIPRGEKHRGLKELTWKKHDLLNLNI